MRQKFRHFLDKEQLFSKSNKILVANSGGIDSMVLTKLLELDGFDFGIAHCNFRLRGDESNADEEFVQQLAEKLKVPFFCRSFETEEYARAHRCSIQEAARELRYGWFEKLILETEFDYYATAHHFDDQIETFFINLFRGTGVSGLRGINPITGRCVRPLLFATRTEIEDFANAHHIACREDSSNKSDHYLRNRIRHHVLPALEVAKPDFRHGFATTFKNLRFVENFIGHQMQIISGQIITDKHGYLQIDLKKLRSFKHLHFILFELLKPMGFNYDTVLDIVNSLEGTPGKTFYAGKVKLVVDRDALLLVPDDRDAAPGAGRRFRVYEYETATDSPVKLKMDKLPFTSDYKIELGNEVAQLDFDKLTFPLEIRKAETGDFFYPFGMKGKKKLSDYFTDEKFSAARKLQTWLLVSAGQIAWVIGHRPDDRFKITPDTKTIYRVRLKECNESNKSALPE
jgi:tRNA(Ile)-lysidine synthase